MHSLWVCLINKRVLWIHIIRTNTAEGDVDYCLGHHGIGLVAINGASLSRYLCGFWVSVGLCQQSVYRMACSDLDRDKTVSAIRSIQLAYSSVYRARSIIHVYLLADCCRSSRRLLLRQGLAVAQFTAHRKAARAVSCHWEMLRRHLPLFRTCRHLTAPPHRRRHRPSVCRGRRGRRVVRRRRQSHNSRTTVRRLVSPRPPATNEPQWRAFFRWPNVAMDVDQGRRAARAGHASQARTSTDRSGSSIVRRSSEASRSPTTSLRSLRPVTHTATIRPPPTTRTPLRHLQASNVLLWPRLSPLPMFTSPNLKMIRSFELLFRLIALTVSCCNILNTKTGHFNGPDYIARIMSYVI